MRLTDLLIETGNTTSNEVDLTGIRTFALYAPAALLAPATVQLSPDKGISWYSLGATVGAGVRQVPTTPALASSIRLTIPGVEATDKAFVVHGYTQPIGA